MSGAGVEDVGLLGKSTLLLLLFVIVSLLIKVSRDLHSLLLE